MRGVSCLTAAPSKERTRAEAKGGADTSGRFNAKRLWEVLRPRQCSGREREKTAMPRRSQAGCPAELATGWECDEITVVWLLPHRSAS